MSTGKRNDVDKALEVASKEKFTSLIDEFCEITISIKNESQIFMKLSDEDKVFISHVNELRNFTEDNSYFSIIISRVNVYSSKHIYESSKCDKIPFSQITSDFLHEHYEALKKEIIDNNPRFLVFLDFAYEYIASQRLQFEGMKTYINNQDLFLKKIRIDEMERKINKAENTITDITGKLESNEKELANTNKRIQSFNQRMQRIAKKIKNEISGAKKIKNEISDEMNRLQKEMTINHITILGIFSAIVLTFNAGVSFTSIILENVISASIYRAAFMTLIFAAVIGNALIGLFAYLEFVRKKQSKFKAEKNYFKKSVTIRIVGVVNVLLIASLLLIFIFWKSGTIEKRNAEINAKYSTTICNTEIENDKTTVLSAYTEVKKD